VCDRDRAVSAGARGEPAGLDHHPLGDPAQRLSIRGLMIFVAVIAIPLAVFAAIARELEKVLNNPNPAMWAVQQVEYHWEQLGKDPGSRDYHLDQIKKYEELAEGFARLGSTRGEDTLHGAFTDKLSPNQSVITQFTTQAESSSGDGTGSRSGERWSVPPGTECSVVMDWAIDADACSEGRGIEVRILKGPHAGEFALIERIYLRRRP
jgi:hypothetical protein